MAAGLSAYAPLSRIFIARAPGAGIAVGWRNGQSVDWPAFRGLVAGIAGTLDAGDTDSAVIACARPLSFLAALLALWSRNGEAFVPASLQPEAVAAAATGGARILRDADVESAPIFEGGALQLPPSERCRLVLFTSGSTGAPKRVDKTLQQLEREVENLQALWGGTLVRSCLIATVPHTHIYGLLFRLLWPLAAGCPVEEETCGDPQHLRELARRHGRYVLVSTPAHLSRFPELLAPDQWLRPEMIFSSGGPLDAASAAAYRRAFGAAPTEVFGSTETGGVAWRSRDGSASEEVWTPFPGIAVRLDGDGALLLDSVYLPDRGCRMDDAADLLPDGRFVLRGRLDRIVKIEGKRLSLPDLELRLQGSVCVASAWAVPLPAPQRLGVVILPTPEGARVLRRDGAAALRRVLRRHLADAFDATLLPKRFRFVEAPPFSDRGKVAATELQRLFAADAVDDA